ncbi:MAG TPA: cupin domain-containing protein [Candidatus Limnocylindrales bacterium]|nr:cupin domain-containing protein [Candidatus Limnocylindrales bacterium]
MTAPVPASSMFVPHLAGLLPEIAPDSIVSRTFYQDDLVKAILFGFAPGQELSEHTAAVPAAIQIVQGEATITLGSETHEAGPGAWAHMAARLPHSIVAKTEVVMLLWLFQRQP